VEPFRFDIGAKEQFLENHPDGRLLVVLPVAHFAM
jgi:hypothetical protein